MEGGRATPAWCVATIATLLTLTAFAVVREGSLASLLAGDPALTALARLYLGGLVLVLGLSTAGAALLSCVPRTLRIADLAAPSLCYGYAAFYLVFMLTLSVLKTRAFHTYADLATHLEILWRARSGLGLTSAMSAEFWRGPHWFAAHFTPIAYVLVVPLFTLVPDVLALLLLQTIALMSAAIPVMLYARDRLGGRAMSWMGLTFLLYPTLQYINLYEFEYLRFSIPFLAWAFYALHRRWMRLYAGMCGLALLTREEVGLVVFMLGIYAVIAAKRYVAGLATAVAGLGMFVTAVAWIIPAFREGGSLVYGYWFFRPTEVLETGGWSALASRLGTIVTDPVRLGNVAMLLLPFQFLSLASPGILAITLPNITSTLLSSSLAHYSFLLYYLSPSVPFIAFSAVEGMRRVQERLTRNRRMSTEQATVVVAVFVTLGALGTAILFGPSPMSAQFWDADYKIGNFHATNFHWSTYAVTPHARAARAIVDVVPTNAVVSAEQFFLPHLYDRRRMYVFPTMGPDVTHVLIDRHHPLKTGWDNTYLDFRRRPEHYYALIENDPIRWEVVAESDGVRLFRRR
jgi:uncharacterized membrane protein